MKVHGVSVTAIRLAFALQSARSLRTTPRSSNSSSSSPSSSQAVHVSPTHLNALLNNAKNITNATQIHAQMVVNGYVFLPFLFNNLINLYARCGFIKQSLALFSTTHDDESKTKNVVTWTTLIVHLSRTNKPRQALEFFNQMRRTGVDPNQFTFSAALPACAGTTFVVHGEQMHSLICRHGYGFHLYVASALVDMYAKCSGMRAAEILFDEMPERNVVSWNSLIVGFLQNNLYVRAIESFKKVIAEALRPDQVSFSSVLSACASLVVADNGKQVHGLVLKHGLVTVAPVKASLMDMYSKCGILEDAVKLFQSAGDRNVVTWNVMIMAYVQNDNSKVACSFFWIMKREGVSPDEASLSTVLHAIANLSALDQGTLIHDQIMKTGFQFYPCVTSSLITMYAKCGSLVDAQQVFEEREAQNVVAWTALISAYHHHGHANRAIELFEEMLGQGIMPSHITFISVLSACGHTGSVEKGFAYFNSITEIHNMSPGAEHYACMVDMLGRAGRLHEAKKFAESVASQHHIAVWGALLGACRNHGDLEMGRAAALRLFEIEPYNPGNYVLLSDMYLQSGRLEEGSEIRRLMGVNGVKKEPGCSWVDVKNRFVFTAHD